MELFNSGLPEFGTGIVLAERGFALGIASQQAETNATNGPVRNKANKLPFEHLIRATVRKKSPANTTNFMYTLIYMSLKYEHFCTL